MSGGSWNYLYMQLEEAAQRLKADPDLLRQALGLHMDWVANAMHAVEWNDSGDGAPDEDKLIQRVVDVDTLDEAVRERLRVMRGAIERWETQYNTKRGL